MQLAPDTSDFDALYRAHHGFVWRTLRHLGVGDDRIDDALQDTFLVVHRRLAEFAGRAALRTWLFEIARRVAGRYRRTAAREAPRRCEVPELEAPARLDDDLARSEAAEILTVFLDELDRDKSVVFIMAELEQRRAPEIAETLDLNLNTVYARLRAARQQLDRLINRLQARERRPQIRRATEVIAAALLIKVPAAELAAPIAAAAPVAASMLAPAGIFAGLTLAIVAALSTPPAPAPTPLQESRPVPADSHRQSHQSPAPPVALPVAPRTLTPAAPTKPSELERELALIEPARAALLAGDTRTALRLSTRHRSNFKDGIFAQEAAAARIEALCRLGDERATGELATFRERWPASSLQAWLDTTCAAPGL